MIHSGNGVSAPLNHKMKCDQNNSEPKMNSWNMSFVDHKLRQFRPIRSLTPALSAYIIKTK